MFSLFISMSFVLCCVLFFLYGRSCKEAVCHHWVETKSCKIVLYYFIIFSVIAPFCVRVCCQIAFLLHLSLSCILAVTVSESKKFLTKQFTAKQQNITNVLSRDGETEAMVILASVMHIPSSFLSRGWCYSSVFYLCTFVVVVLLFLLLFPPIICQYVICEHVCDNMCLFASQSTQN